MKLYLSSDGFGTQPENLFGLIGNKKRAAIVLNAADFLDEENRRTNLLRTISEFENAGIEAFELDLRDYFSKSGHLSSVMEKIGLLWAVGGNTFILRRAYFQSGLEQILPKLLQNEHLVYGGFSAGACVATPSLHGIDLVDLPHVVPKGYSNEVIWEGLKLVNFHVAPHFRSTLPEYAKIKDIVAYFEQRNLPYYALRDGEAIVVDGDTIRLV